MINKKFSIAEALSFGLYTTIDHIIFVLSLFLTYIFSMITAISISLIVGVYYLLPDKAASLLSNTQYLQSFGSTRAYLESITLPKVFLILGCGLCIIALHYLLTLGTTQVALDLYDYNQSTIKRLFSCKRLILQAMIGAFLYNLVTVIGYGLFLFPGIYFSLRFGFYQQVLVDKNVGIFEAFRASSAITRGSLMLLWGLEIILGALHVTATLLLGFGLIMVIPISLLAKTYAYRKLSQVTSSKIPVQPFEEAIVS